LSQGQSGVWLSFSSIFAADIEALSAYYADVFGLAEVISLRSPHFRGLQVGATILGFSAAATAYELLELDRPRTADPAVRTFVTFEMDSAGAVDKTVALAVPAGATLIQDPHQTYYGAWQAVLLDPEGNAFRINYSPELHTP
jgi:uncharacterized glyoxalase superfamily protein PhnB